jgi:peptidoglycan/LPS O-acetylase OafA/YrhL
MAVVSPAQASTSGRLPYLDWLKFFVVLSLAPFHAALSFTGMGAVYVYDTPVRDALLAHTFHGALGPRALQIFTVFMDNWFMHLLFLISGVGAAASLNKRTGRRFIGERANRLLLPLLAGTLVVISFQAWLRALSFGTFTGGFFSFYPSFFNGISSGPGSRYNFDYGQLWFLLYLFVFSLLTLPLFLRWNRSGDASPALVAGRRLAGGTGILLPALWIAVLEAAFRPGWPGYQNLVNDWANFTVYLSFFLFGYVAGKERVLLESAERNRLLALLLGILAFVARLAVYRVFTVSAGYSPANALAQGLRGIAAFCVVTAVMGYGRHWLNQEGPALGRARDLSFPLYMLHFAPLCLATYLLLGTGLSVWARWGIATAASWLTVAVFTELARFVPPLRDFFGIRGWGRHKEPSRKPQEAKSR